LICELSKKCLLKKKLLYALARNVRVPAARRVARLKIAPAMKIANAVKVLAREKRNALRKNPLVRKKNARRSLKWDAAANVVAVVVAANARVCLQ